jgi:hypothetical protein
VLQPRLVHHTRAPGRMTDAAVLCLMVGVPHWRMASVNSARRMSRTCSTPSCPNADRP